MKLKNKIKLFYKKIIIQLFLIIYKKPIYINSLKLNNFNVKRFNIDKKNIKFMKLTKVEYSQIKTTLQHILQAIMSLPKVQCNLRNGM